MKETQHVTVTVFNTMGQRVALLHKGVLEADKTRPFIFDARPFPGGVYFIRVQGKHVEETRRVVALK